MKTHIKIWLNNAKKKGTKSPIYLRLLKDGTKTEISLYISISKSHFDLKNERIIEKFDLENGNKIIDKFKKKVNVAIDYYDKLDKQYSVNDIKDFLFDRQIVDKKYTTFNDLFEHYRKYMIESKKWTFSTLQCAENTIKHFSKYLLEIKREKLENINHITLMDFENVMIQKGYKNKTIIKLINRLKTIVNYAYRNELIKDNIFARHQTIKNEKTEIVYLNEEEVEKIENYKSNNFELNKIRDFFLIQICTGMSFIDVVNINREDFKHNIQNDYYFIRKKRQKTKTFFEIPLNKKTTEIFKKYDYQSPFKKAYELNVGLKKIQTDLNIETHITSHVGRKTFATNCIKKGIKIEIIAKMLGHSNIQTTLSAYAAIQQETIFEEMKKIEIF